MAYIKKTRTYFKGSQVRKKDREKLLAIGKCMYCGDTELLEIEHIVACKNGGGSDIKNLTVSCSKCNTQKGSFTIDIFLARIILKRDKVFNDVFRYTVELRKRKRRGSIPAVEQMCVEKIKEYRGIHSYYTRIIHSILTQKYLINGKD